jgi:hypothetical protein
MLNPILKKDTSNLMCPYCSKGVILLRLIDKLKGEGIIVIIKK